MKSYKQYCGLAKALDVVGDRWTLLIVRELLIRPACRYTDLQNGLPGIATNLLAARLKSLEEAGLVEKQEAATLFSLTPRGRELEATVRALGLWGAPLLAQADLEDTFRSHWLLMPLTMLLRDRYPKAKPVTVELRTGEGQPLVLEASGGEVRARVGKASAPDAVLTGHPGALLALLTGKTKLSKSVRLVGNAAILKRFI